jgi:hypothetical protein
VSTVGTCTHPPRICFFEPLDKSFSVSLLAFNLPTLARPFYAALSFLVPVFFIAFRFLSNGLRFLSSPAGSYASVLSGPLDDGRSSNFVCPGA